MRPPFSVCGIILPAWSHDQSSSWSDRKRPVSIRHCHSERSEESLPAAGRFGRGCFDCGRASRRRSSILAQHDNEEDASGATQPRQRFSSSLPSPSCRLLTVSLMARERWVDWGRGPGFSPATSLQKATKEPRKRRQARRMSRKYRGKKGRRREE